MSSADIWKPLLAPDQFQPGDVSRTFREVVKRGHPFLLLPDRRKPAAETLHLYPAQKPKAHRARSALRFLVRWGLPTGLRQVALSLSTADPFMRFMASLTADPVSRLPCVGVLAGNPASAGQRFLVLVFDQKQKAVAAVKAGLSEEARGLIQRESQFLQQLDSRQAGIPTFLSEVDLPHLRGFAVRYYPGTSPDPSAFAEVANILGSWLVPQSTVTLAGTECWQQLTNKAANDPLFGELARDLSSRPVAATLSHGDFAPWNIKVGPDGQWTVLDWERGQLRGIPGWDWFHYVIQTAILVERLPIEGLVKTVEKLLRSYLFREYASRAGILQKERELLLSYLLYCVHVIQPSEGLQENQELLDALRESA